MTQGSNNPEVDANPAPTNLSATTDLAKLAFANMERGMRSLTNNLESTVKIAERGVIPFLLGAGVVLVFFCLVLRVNFSKDHPLASLTTGEFIAVFVVGGLLVIAGAGLRAWTYAREFTLRKDDLTVRLRILEATAGLAEKGMKASSDIALANTTIANTQISAGIASTQTAVEAASKSLAAAAGGDGKI